jgi:hypothetical protein
MATAKSEPTIVQEAKAVTRQARKKRKKAACEGLAAG